MSRHRTQLPDKPTIKGPGQELVAWLPFENRHSDPGSVLVSVCALVALENYPPPRLHGCVRSVFFWPFFPSEKKLPLFCTIAVEDAFNILIQNESIRNGLISKSC